jgi:hypothetical protein
MKNKLYLFIAFAAIMFAGGCTSDEPLFPTPVSEENSVAVANSVKRSLTEALGISAASRRATRATDNMVASIDYVVQQCDTVAYIVNYANDGGFAILAADRVVKPILAYSDQGSFSTDNEMAMNYFVSNIKNYAEEVKRSAPLIVSRNELLDTIRYIHDPVIKIKLGQRNPYDAIVKKYHPGCPVGCGPIAAFTLMAYCKRDLVLDLMYYDFKFITGILPLGRDTMMRPGIIDIPVVNPQKLSFSTNVKSWALTYTGALTATQTLLYKLGKRMNATYTPNETKSRLDSALITLKETGYKVSATMDYHPKEMAININEKNRMYFQRGQSLRDSVKGHFWVIDGCKYSLIANSTSIIDTIDTELYCHWGWYGHCDGYYTGEIFSPDPDPNPATRLEYSASLNFYVQSEIKNEND